MAKRSFLKHALIYGAGDLLVYSTGFILLPLYVRCLSRAEYGTLDILNRLGEMVLLCLLFKGLRQALFSFHNQAETERDRRAAVGTALFVTLLILGSGGVLTALAAEPISAWLELGDPSSLRLAVVAVLAEALTALLLSLAQARAESLLFAITSVAQFMARMVLCIVLVTAFDWGIEGVLISSAVASGLCAIWLLGREIRRGGLRIDGGQLRDMLRFALPFVPGGFGFFLLNSGDRFFLLQHVSRSDLGIYALGYKLALVVKLFSRQPLYRVWSARMYEAAKQPDAPIVFGRVFTRILAVYAGVGLGLSLTAGEAVAILAGDAYASAAAIVPPVVMAYYFMTAADLMESGLYITRKTAWKLPITLAGTVVTLALYALLIPASGTMAAALGTLFGFLFTAALTGVVTQRVFVVRYEWGRVSAVAAWAVLFWLGGLLLPVEWWMIPVKFGVWLVWLAAVWFTVLTDEEKRWAKPRFEARVRKIEVAGSPIAA